MPSARAEAGAWDELADWRRHIFARQCLPVFAVLDALPRADRLTLDELREVLRHVLQPFGTARNLGDGGDIPWCRTDRR